MTPISSQQIARVATMLSEADAVLVGAGAGLTAAAGISYLDEEKFAEVFPGWVKKGFRKQYELMGYPYWTQKEQWGYYKVHLEYVYFSQIENTLYKSLYELIVDKDYFVMTSNVDGLFYKNGVDRERFYAPQGDYGKIQCTRPCSQEVWDINPFLDRMDNAFDSEEQVLTSDEVVPACPNCGGEMFIHARIDRSFVDAVHQEEYQNLMNWLQQIMDKRVLLLDLGSGFNTPTIVRMPMEQISRSLAHANLVRVNLDYADLPDDLEGSGLAIKGDIREFIEKLAKEFK